MYGGLAVVYDGIFQTVFLVQINVKYNTVNLDLYFSFLLLFLI